MVEKKWRIFKTCSLGVQVWLASPRRWLVFFLGLVIVIFAWHTIWLHLEMNELADHYYVLGESGYSTLFEIEAVENSLLDMETGERGYLLTGEKSFLEPYNKGREEIDRHLSTLLATVNPESPVYQRLKEIRENAGVWIKQVAEPNIALREKIDNGQLSPGELGARLQEEKGKEMMDRLRRDISRFKEITRTELQQQLAGMYALHRRLAWQIYSSAVAAVLVVILLGVLLLKRLQLIEETSQTLAEQKERLQIMVAELEAASKLKSEFLANMSHELRTPLNAVIGFAQVLQKQAYGPLTEKQSAYVEYILTSGRHLLGLINDILDLSKIEAGKEELELTDVSLPEVFQNSLLMVREKARRHRIALYWAVAEDVPRITADERKLRQIIYNLLGNAVKFTPDGGSVRIAARLAADGGVAEAGKYVEISVADTGIGIPLAEQERIFAPFVQADSGHARRYEGTGLGLALVRRLVELHGGRVWVRSEGEGRGSTFSFTLPVDPKEKGAVQ